MINKQSLWFITLFSLVLILGIYYVSMPKDALASFTGNLEDNSKIVEVTESDIIIAMKVEEEEKLLNDMDTAQQKLLDLASSIEERNDAYKMILNLSTKKTNVEKIEKLLKDKYNLDSCVKMEDNQIAIIIDGENLGNEYANKIISTVQGEFKEQMYITVKFQK